MHLDPYVFVLTSLVQYVKYKALYVPKLFFSRMNVNELTKTKFHIGHMMCLWGYVNKNKFGMVRRKSLFIPRRRRRRVDDPYSSVTDEDNVIAKEEVVAKEDMWSIMDKTSICLDECMKRINIIGKDSCNITKEFWWNEIWLKRNSTLFCLMTKSIFDATIWNYFACISL